MSQTLLAFKAGRCFRREGTNFVDSDPTKGSITLTRNNDDGLLHFTWKNRGSNEEEDLILFPADATFEKVTQSSSGRVYILKFSSSNQKHFFWMQDASTARDEEFATNLNTLLQDPDAAVTWSSASASGSGSGSGSASGQGDDDAMNTEDSNTDTAANVNTTGSAAPGLNMTPEQLNELSRLILGATGADPDDDISLTDILTPANLNPLLTAHPEIINDLLPHLPPDLPVRPDGEAVKRIINSPPFRAAVSNLDQALRTGLLGGMVRQLGLPEEAGMGVGAFLRAVQEQGDRQNANREGEGGSGGSGGDTMDTD